MKNFAVIFVIVFFCSLSYSQTAHFSYNTIRHNSGTKISKSRSDFNFPVFSSFKNKAIAEKVNQTLQISELGLLKGFETDNIFEQVSIDDGRIYGGKVSINYEVYDRNSKVLSVKFDQSSCGATCAYWVKYYNFNAENGDLVQLKDLFTEEGYKKFFDFAAKRRVAQLRREIKKLPSDEKEGYYEITGSYESDDLTDFYIKNNALYIDGENSFSKNQKFSSVEISKISKFKSSEFKKYLNSYGKGLFSLSKDSIKKYRSESFPQLFRGKIGNSNVLLFMNNGDENEMKAEYVYTKYGRGIFLKGALNKTELTLTEKLPKPRETGFIDYVDSGIIRANFDGKNIIGTWVNKDGEKTHNLKLTRN